MKIIFAPGSAYDKFDVNRIPEMFLMYYKQKSILKYLLIRKMKFHPLGFV
jgi:hypothetical protein